MRLDDSGIDSLLLRRWSRGSRVRAGEFDARFSGGLEAELDGGSGL
jgi:hypothetical protein